MAVAASTRKVEPEAATALPSIHSSRDAYRQETLFAIGRHYIHNYPSADYQRMFFAERAHQPSLIEIRTHFMHNEQGWYDRDHHQRTVLYMGPQPAPNGR